ncbi:MAG TPA: 4'-phosphopantetheinyl transferase superfamily protein [Stellaceae bacterium]|nr:4'-phosphopantetheinyl transferase superfamily protein [Stellaceae bacterium]
MTIWKAALDLFDEETLMRFQGPGEDEERARLRFPHLRRRALGRRAALRDLLARRLGVAPAEVRFTRNEWGKLATADVHFNVSSSGEIALLVLSKRGPIGIDIERERPDWEWGEIIDIIGTEEERHFIRALPPVERAKSVLRLWVAKEAVVKADGRGLSLNVTEIDARVVARPGAGRVKLAQEYHVLAFDPCPFHVAAVAASFPISGVTIETWEPRPYFRDSTAC